MAENRPLLNQISQRYGVPPQILVALWGVESGFGQNMGSFSVIGSLSTLAYDGPPVELFPQGTAVGPADPRSRARDADGDAGLLGRRHGDNPSSCRRAS